MSHRFDKTKFYNGLRNRHWHQGPNKEWIPPVESTTEQIDKDWLDSILEGVICEPNTDKN